VETSTKSQYLQSRGSFTYKYLEYSHIFGGCFTVTAGVQTLQAVSLHYVQA